MKKLFSKISLLVFLLISNYSIFANEIDNFFFSKNFKSVIISYGRENIEPKSNRDFYILGVSNFFINNYDEALKYFNKLDTELYKYNFDFAEYYEAFIHFFRKDYKNAISKFKIIAKKENQIQEYGKYLYYFSISLIEIENYDLALKYLEKGLSSNQEYYKPYYSFTIGRLYYNLEDYKSAIIEFKRFILKYVNSKLIDDSIFYLGKSYYYINDYKNSKKDFLLLINNYKDSEYFYDAYYYLGKITGNREYFLKIIENKSDYAEIDFVYYLIGKIYFNSEEKESSFQMFTKCLDVTKNDNLSYNSLVYIFKILEGNEKEILSTIKKYIDKIGNIDKFLKYALILIINNEEYDEFKYFNISKYINKVLNNADIMYLYGKVFLKMNNNKQALVYLNKCIELDESNPKYLYYAGFINFLEKKFIKARSFFEKAISISPNSNKYRHSSIKYLGFIEIKDKNYQKAYDLYSPFLRTNPGSDMYYEIAYYQSMICYNIKKYNEASYFINKVLNNTDDTFILYNLIIFNSVKILHKTNLSKATEIYISKAQYLDSKYELAFLLGDKYLANSNYENAINMYSYAKKSEDLKILIEAKLRIFNTYISIPSYKKANEIIKELYDLNSAYKRNTIIKNYIDILLELNNEKDIEVLFNELLKTANKNDILYSSRQLYGFYLKKKNYEKSFNYLNHIIESTDKENISDLLFEKAYLLFKLKQYEEAQYILEDVKKSGQYSDMFAINDLLYDIYKELKLYTKLASVIKYNLIQDTKDSELIYFDVVELIKLIESKKINNDYASEILSNILNKDTIQYRLLKLFSKRYSFNNRESFEAYYKPYLKSNNKQIRFWAKYIFAEFYLNISQSDLAYKILKDMKKNNTIEEEIILYKLSYIEIKEEYERKYYNEFINKYPNSIFKELLNEKK